MDTQTVKSIEVKALDPSTAEEITKALNEAKPMEDGSKVLRLDFKSSNKGDILTAMSLVQDMHKSETECIATCGGTLNLASALAVAGCKFGARKAESASLFNLFSGDEKSAGKKRKSLTAEEKNALEILDKLSGGRKARIKALMLAGSKATAAEIKSLGLIYVVEGEFVDKYEKARIDAKKKK